MLSFIEKANKKSNSMEAVVREKDQQIRTEQGPTDTAVTIKIV